MKHPAGRRRVTHPSPPRPARRGSTSLVSSLGWFAGSYGVAVLGYLALSAIASRMLGPGQFGYFIIVLTAGTIVGELALVGVHRAGLREVARLTQGDPASHAAVGALRLRVRVTCLINLPIVGAASGALAAALGDIWTGVAVGLLVVLSGHQKLWANMLRGYGLVRFAGLLEGRSGGALVAVLQAAALAGLWAVDADPGLAGALFSVALAYVPPIAVAWLMVHRRWRSTQVPTLSWPRLRASVGHDWRFASGQLGSYLNANLELWLAGLLLSAGDTSLFGAAQRLSLLLAAPITSLQVVFAPAVARLAHSADNDDRQRLQRLVRTGATVAAVPMILILLPIAFAPDAFLGLVFGASFSAGGTILLLVLVGAAANVWSGLCGAVLSMSDHEGAVAAVQWLGVGVRVVAGLTAALTLGLNGLAATAGLVTAGVWLALWWSAWRKVGVKTHPALRPSLRLLRDTAG